jgi:1-acyl-sn-glycerol-3-phosphate acyltransferase
MIVTCIWAAGFAFTMLLTVPFLFLYYLLKLLTGDKIADKYARVVTKTWARLIIVSTGSKVTVIGKENLSKTNNICFISNHQSLFDIPLLMGWLDKPLGFIAKRELKRIPVINGWIMAIHSAFIDRSNSRKAIESINRGSESIRSGHPIAIFPEGTRSRDGILTPFKTGSLKLATNAEAVIQPLSVLGTYQVYEKTGRIRSSSLTLLIHPVITSEDPDYKDKEKLILKLQQMISSVIPEQS